MMGSVSDIVIGRWHSGSSFRNAGMIEIFSPSAGRSMAPNVRREKLREDSPTPFSPAMACKDLHDLREPARTLKRRLFSESIAKELFAMTFLNDLDNLNFSGIYAEIMKEFIASHNFSSLVYA